MVRFKKLTMPFKLLVIWQFIDLLLDYSNQLCISIYKNNALLSHVETIMEYVAYAAIYYYLFKSRVIKKLVIGSALLIVLFAVINGFFLQPFTKVFPTYVIMPAEILYVVFAILLFKQMLQYAVQTNIVKQSVFWFNTGILFFSSTMFLNLGLMNYYSRYHKGNFTIILCFWYSIDVIFSILITIAILTDKKNEIAVNG